MFKIIILILHFLGFAIAGHFTYSNELPFYTGNGNVKSINFINTASQEIRINSVIEPLSHYDKSFYYFISPDEVIDRVHTQVLRTIPTQEQQKKSLQVFIVTSSEQNAKERDALNLAKNLIEQQQQKLQQKSHKETNIRSNKFLQNRLSSRQLAKSSGSQAPLTPEVHFIKYNTDAEADQVIEQIKRAHYNDSPNASRRRVSHAAVQLPATKPELVQYAGSSNSPNINPPPQSQLSVHKNYAMNYLPTGVDVVPGSSYIPLRRI